MRLTVTGITLNVESDQLNRIQTTLDMILEKEVRIMGTLEDLKSLIQTQISKIEALNTALDGYRELVTTIKTELEALKSGAQLAPAVQAKVDAIIADAQTVTTKIDETYNENFPPAGSSSSPDEV